MRNKKISATLALMAGLAALGTVSPAFAADPALPGTDASQTLAGGALTGTTTSGVGFTDGVFQINQVPNLDFGKHAAYDNTVYDVQEADGANKDRLISVTDAHGAADGWTLTVKRDAFKDGTDATMDGDAQTTLSLKAGTVGVIKYTQPGAGQTPTDPAGTSMAGHEPTASDVTLTTAGPAQEVFKADQATDPLKGKGTWSIDLNAAGAASLEMLGAQKTGDYKSTLTWTLAAGPTAGNNPIK